MPDVPDTDDALTDDTDEPDPRIRHGSYRIKRPGARISLNDNDCQLDSDRTELVVGSLPDAVSDPQGVVLQATLSDGGFLEAYAGLTLDPEDARDVADALYEAADAVEGDERGWFR